MNRPELVLAQLYAMRQQLDVVIAMFEPAPETSFGGKAACEHPEEKRLDAATTEHPNAFICGVCDKEVLG